MKLSLFAGGLGPLLLLAGTSSAATQNFSGDLIVAEEVPKVPGGPAPNVDGHDPSGGAVFTYDDNTKFLCGRFEWNDLTGTPTGLHVHLGAQGTNGAVKFIIPPPAAGVNQVTFKLLLPAEFQTALFTRGVYSNIHTARNPDGEIRAQIDEENGLDFEIACPSGAPITLAPVVPDAGAGDGGSTSSSSSTGGTDGTSGGLGGGRDGNAADPGDTPETNGETKKSTDPGGCNTSSTSTNALSVAAAGGLAVAALRRRRRGRRSGS